MSATRLALVPEPPPIAAEFAALYREQHAFVWRILRHLGVPGPQLDDRVQDVFLVVYRRWDSFDRESSMRSWLYGIARRVAADQHRGDRRTQRRLEAVPEPGPEPGPEQLLARAEAADFVDQFLATLEPGRREVFVLAEVGRRRQQVDQPRVPIVELEAQASGVVGEPLIPQGPTQAPAEVGRVEQRIVEQLEAARAVVLGQAQAEGLVPEPARQLAPQAQQQLVRDAALAVGQPRRRAAVGRQQVVDDHAPAARRLDEHAHQQDRPGRIGGRGAHGRSPGECTWPGAPRSTRTADPGAPAPKPPRQRARAAGCIRITRPCDGLNPTDVASSGLGFRIAAAAGPNGSVAVVWRGQDGKFHSTGYAAGLWFGPYDMPTAPDITGTPAIASGVGMHVAETAFINGGTVYHSFFNGNVWSNPTVIGGATINSVALARSK